MSKKTEVVVDDNGIITKQSEVYVWNDQVFASYKAAFAASKKSLLVEMLAKKHYGTTVTAAQLASYIKTWQQNPMSYTIYVDHAISVFTELLADHVKD